MFLILIFNNTCKFLVAYNFSICVLIVSEVATQTLLYDVFAYSTRRLKLTKP